MEENNKNSKHCERLLNIYSNTFGVFRYDFRFLGMMKSQPQLNQRPKYQAWICKIMPHMW